MATALGSRRGARKPPLQEIVRRIVRAARPEKIILFGSAARGEMGPDSDVDLLVVKRNVHRRKLAQALYMELGGVGVSKDIVVVTPEDIDRYKDDPGLVIMPALEEGKVIYEASRKPAARTRDGA